MSEYAPPLEDFNFVLNHVADLEQVSKLNGYQHADPGTVATILEEAGRFYSEVMAPLNRTGDQQGSTLDADGHVHTPEGFPEAYAKMVESGWPGAHLPAEWGGGGLPYTVGVVIQEMFKSANMAFSLCGMLTQGTVEAIVEHSTNEMKETYLERLVSGEWTGTMNLTEPEAGSDVGALRTKAVKQDDGTYRLFGTKIFITWGDHDVADNVIHMVLARTEGAPPGTRGISMFLVPKHIPDAAGNPGERNDYKIVSIEHKLGIHASPTCVISFGDAGDGAVGYLVGDEMAGMHNMFTMMNVARIGVGMEGLALSERAYQQASAYANDRLQGRPIGASSTESVPIVEHPDVRRMLLTIRANTEAMRSLLYLTAQIGDLSLHADTAEERDTASKRLALLTPVVKAWMTDLGVEMTSLGIQVHGGMGYVEETGAAQLFRDSRIAPIYEGTNGIQAIDLVLRKIPVDGGAVIESLITEMTSVLDEMSDFDDLGHFRDDLTTAIQGLAETSAWIGERLSEGAINDALAAATPFLAQFGTVLGGWLMAVSAVAAKRAPGEFSEDFLSNKVVTARFYGEHLLGRANGLIPTIKAGGELLADASL
ncbi:MAG: acyl-CoA dehydrogenase [Acidimicrobiia bacterium]|jgi:alkylation response protein AidB-like acyl-CoA dehydrogenase